MTTDEALALIRALHAREEALFHSKGAEYRLSDDQLDNFHRCARELGVTPLQAAGLFLEKHMSSIKNYIKNPKPDTELSEPIRERIVDARNYLFFIAALIDEAQGGEAELNRVFPSGVGVLPCNQHTAVETPCTVNNMSEIIEQAPPTFGTMHPNDTHIVHYYVGEAPTFDNLVCGDVQADAVFSCTPHREQVTCGTCLEIMSVPGFDDGREN